MADDDNFDIDIYGDEAPELLHEPADQIQEDVQDQDDTFELDADGTNVELPPNEAETEPQIADQDLQDFGGDGTNDIEVKYEDTVYEGGDQQQSVVSGPQAGSANQPPQQGMKREADADNAQIIDPHATAGLKLGELQWFITEDDVRGWLNQCGHEDALKELTFNEAKLNGKSKGSVSL